MTFILDFYGKTIGNIVKLFLTVLILIVCWPGLMKAQEENTEQKDLNISLAYAIPRYDNFFRGGFESRIGGAGGFHIQQERIRYGLRLGIQQFTKRVNNPVDVERAVFWMLDGNLGYDLLKRSSNRLDPNIAVGVAYISYNFGAIRATSFYLSPGVNYLFHVSDNYFLEAGMSFLHIFDRFGGQFNIYDSNYMQLIELRLGLTFLL